MSRATFRAMIKKHNAKDPLALAKLDALCIAEELGYTEMFSDCIDRIINATRESQITLALRSARERWVVD